MQQLWRMIGRRPSALRNGPVLAQFGSDEGQTLAEYALILALIAVIAVLALIFLGGTITSLFSSVGNSV